jgi:hypothetical protein
MSVPLTHWLEHEGGEGGETEERSRAAREPCVMCDRPMTAVNQTGQSRNFRKDGAYFALMPE